MLRRFMLVGSWFLMQQTVAAFVLPTSIPRPHQHTKAIDSPFATITNSINSDSSSINDNDSLKSDANIPNNHADAIICGGGPAGLLMAIALAQQQLQKYQRIHVYDRLGPPPPVDDESLWSDQVARYYLIGLGDRGQAALRAFGVWDAVAARSVVVRGRRDWSPGGPDDGVERIFNPEQRKVQTHVLPRDKLVGVLAEYVAEHHSDQVTVHYGYEVTPVEFQHSTTQALVRVAPCGSAPSTSEEENAEDVTCDTDSSTLWATDLLVAADGTVRTIANAMQAEDEATCSWWRRKFHIHRYVDDNIRVYKTIPLQLSWRPDLNYSARTSRIGFDALPANKSGRYCGVLLLRPDDPLAQPNADPVALRALLDTEIPQFSPLVDDTVLAQVARKPVSSLPAFRYATPRLHQGASTIVLGDAAHTVKPYFGLGANSALEDVEELATCLKDTTDTAQAIRTFSRRRARESKTLVRLSRDLDRPGKLGFLTFLGPIILDGIFGNMLPWLFAPNMITMLQRDAITFQQAARRKRLDRIVQVSLIGSALVGSTVAAVRLVRWGMAQSPQQRGIIAGAVATTTAIGVGMRRLRKRRGEAKQ